MYCYFVGIKVTKSMSRISYQLFNQTNLNPVSRAVARAPLVRRRLDGYLCTILKPLE